MGRAVLYIVGGIVGVFAIIAVLGKVFPPEQKPTPDALCAYVKGQLAADSMNCVGILAAESVLGPGNYVPPLPQGPGDAKVSLTAGSLFADSCQLRGANVSILQKAAFNRRPISVQSIDFEANHTLKAQSTLDIPKLGNTDVEIGPEWDTVTKISLTIPNAWYLLLDEHAIKDAISSCNIKRECVQDVLDKKYEVIESAIVGDGVQYEMRDRDNRVFSAAAAGKAKAFSVRVGGKIVQNADESATLKASSPVVLAVRFVPKAVLQQISPCPELVQFLADGEAIVKISGGGGTGNIGPAQTAKAEVGGSAAVSAEGSEESECETGHDLTRSSARAEASVTSDNQTSVRLRYNLDAQGGHYATVDSCVFGKAVGYHGYDTSVSSSVELRGGIRTKVRTDSTQRLSLSYTNLPDGSSVRVLDPSGQPVPVFAPAPNGDSKRVDLASISGTGMGRFETREAGVYVVETAIHFYSDVNGAGHAHNSVDSVVTVSLATK